jgi:hypothetical protein
MQLWRISCIGWPTKKKEAILSLISNSLKTAAAIALSASGFAVAQTIVVKSAGPSAKAYPPGKSIAVNSNVALKTGDTLTILDGRGTRVLKGPGTFSTTSSTATASSYGSLLRNTGTRQVRTGAVRGITGGPAVRPPNVWLIDASKSGTVCVAGTEAVSLWMPAHQAETAITVTRVSDGKSVPLTLRAMQSVKAWPATEFPINNGDQFRVAMAGMSNSSLITFAKLGPNPQGLEGTAAALIKAGCNAQLDLLIETVSASSVEDGTAG